MKPNLKSAIERNRQREADKREREAAFRRSILSEHDRVCFDIASRNGTPYTDTDGTVYHPAT